MVAHGPLPPRSQLELMQGDELLRTLGITDASAGLARFAARMLAEADEYDARTYPVTLDEKLDELMGELTDRDVTALASGSRILCQRRIPGVRRDHDELRNDRARIRYLTARIIRAHLRELAD